VANSHLHDDSSWMKQAVNCGNLLRYKTTISALYLAYMISRRISIGILGVKSSSAVTVTYTVYL
jgi:hypothetical protein